MLEEYCDLLYRANEGELGEKELRKHLIKIENGVKSELAPDRIEVVFFPYRASMFDAFESVYRAAAEDPACDAYVVPIPWYELNPDGTLGRMHIDADGYPEGIPVTDFREYDVEARRPDVIFTHYPYDDNVSNASIHPDFYGKRLREFTDLLCYIPYFVTPFDTVDDYCWGLPGEVYAHRVILQSEPVRRSYIEHYKKFDGEQGWKGRFGKAEEKFLALGSPKFDKVINAKREDFTLPEAWRRRIERPDGSMRKAVLYNTHMFVWLEGGEDYFKKLRSVFALFRERDDAVLWWRPHPNTELNFRTKRPQLLGEYKKLVAEYKLAGFGVYDDTPDLHRAIAWTDAYYGDQSSLVAMYAVTGKPVMIQDANVLPEKERKDALLFESCYDDGTHIWFAAYWFNGLFRCDKET